MNPTIRQRPAGASPLAVVADDAFVGFDCIVHAFAIIGRVPDCSPALARQPEALDASIIQTGCVIGPGAIVYRSVTIGRDSLVGDHATIREGVRTGARCVIGRHVTIGYDAVLEDDVRLNDGVHITGGTRIGAGCFFGPGVLTSNDRNIDLRNYGFHGITAPVFGRRVMVGTGANILAGVTIGDDAIIGAGAVVVEDVPAGSIVLGPKASTRPRVPPLPPAKPITQSMRGA